MEALGSPEAMSQGSAVNNNNHKHLDSLESDIRRFARYTAAKASPYSVDPDDLAQEARLHLLTSVKPDVSDPYARSAILNATRSARRTELRHLTRVQPLDNVLERQSGYRSFTEATTIDVHRFVDRLPVHLRRIYDGLYVRDLDQRALASELGLSQPRVAKLHAELLQKGREFFRHWVN
jgi:RNA polymerase sigma factor (sigma-70 family)